MKKQRKFWLIAAATVLALSGIACGLNPLKPTPTLEPPIRVPATQVPVPTPVQVDAMAGLVGSWLDPDANGTVTTIVAQADGYAVKSVINPDRGSNELTDTSWSNGVLTWTYCIPAANCITSETVSISGDSLSTRWQEDGGSSGETTLERTSPVVVQPLQGNYQDLIGSWLDPDTGTVTTILGLQGSLTIELGH